MEKIDFKDKVALVVCTGIFVSIAERLARDFGKVYLWVPVSGNFPLMTHGQIGSGLNNVEIVESVFGPHFDSIDLFVFCDLGHAPLQIQLESMGKRVFGQRNGEEIEVYREVAKKVMEDVGLPVNPWKLIKGVTALRSYLKANDNQHIKIDRWRGVTESFFSPKYEVVETKLDAIAHDLGPFQEELEFIVESDLPDCVEIGTDTFCIDGQYPENCLVGLECKDLGYVGQMCKWIELPPILKEANEKMAPIFAEYGYRCSLSNELRLPDPKTAYCIDWTCRAPSPPNELWQELLENLSEIIWYGAEGVVVEPKARAKFGVEVILKSDWAKEHNLPVEYPEKYANQIKLYNCVVVDGRRYVLSQDEDMAEIGAVVGWGDTLEEAIEHATAAGEAIQAYGVKFGMGGVEALNSQIEELEKMGISPFQLAKKEK